MVGMRAGHGFRSSNGHRHGGGGSSGNSVLIVSGLTPPVTTPDEVVAAYFLTLANSSHFLPTVAGPCPLPQIFTLFGVFGDVTRVKVLFGKPGTALVQFVDAVHAQRACQYLDKLSLVGPASGGLRVQFSKHPVSFMKFLRSQFKNW